MLNRQVLFGVVLLVALSSYANAQKYSADAIANLDLQERDRRSIDVGWLLRNLLLNSATASDLKANVTRNIIAAQRAPPPPPPPPPTTRRPRPKTTAPPQRPPSSPPPPAPPLNPFFNKFALFASSSNLFKPQPPRSPATTTTTTTEAPTTEPPPPPPRRPRPRPKLRPTHGLDFEYYYPSGFDGFAERSGPRADPSEYDFEDVPAPQQPPPPPPPSRSSAPRKAGRNRQRPASSAPPPTQPAPPPPVRRRPTEPPAAPAPPPPQRARVLYQYAQRDDTSFNDNNNDAAESPAPTPEADFQQLNDNENGGQDGADAEEGGDAIDGEDTANGGDNDLPSFYAGASGLGSLSPRAPSFASRPYPKAPSTPAYDSTSYYGSDSPSIHRFTSFGSGAGSGGLGFSSTSFGFNHASPVKRNYQFRDAFSDFHTTYDGDHFQKGAYSSFEQHFN